MKHVYFVSYASKTNDGHGFGHCIVKRTAIIENDADIPEITNCIKAGATEMTNVIILNFTLLRTEP